MAALGIVTGPIVARALGPEARGEYASVMVYSSFALVICSLGLAVAVSHALNNRLAEPPALLGSTVRFAGLVVVPSLAIAAIVVTFMLSDLSPVARWTCFALISVTPVGVIGLAMHSFLLNRGALGSIAKITVAPLLINTVGVVVLAIIGALTLAAYLAVTICGIVVTWWLTWREVGVKPSRPAPLRPLVRFGSRAYVGSLANVANVQLDQLILPLLIGYAQLGYYAVAVSISNLPSGLAQAIASRTWGNVSGAESLQSGEASRLLRLTILVSSVIAVGLAVASPVLVPLLYSSAFQPAVIPLLLLLPGAVAICVGGTVGVCLIIAGRPGVTSSAQLVALIITAVGLAVVVPPYGIAGAAAVSSAAYGTRVAIQIIVLRRLGVRNLRPGFADLSTIACGMRDRFVRRRRANATP
jgi:O-antigen/teichoic acid export membrane protein